MKSLKFILWVLSVVIGLCVTLRSEEVGKAGRGESLYRVTPSLRTYPTGKYISVMGGANVYQNSSIDVDSRQDYNLQPDMGYAMGIKIGFDWPEFGVKSFESEPISGDDKLKFFPAAEGEFIYTHVGGTEAQTGNYLNTGAASRFGLTYDIYAFMLNGLVKTQWKAFRPYMGAGVGGALLDARMGDVTVDGLGTTATGGKDYDLVFAFQAIAGGEYLLNDRWGIFTEYKYLGLLSPDLQVGGGSRFQNDIVGNHLVMLGVRLHY